ncbi:DUF3558 domain-containing protein [Streptomyces spectabilis]|uniref:DUF3558 domain-containing protein n=1 Tax=Streptomyces spectabilis TaxID=68270 RepID=A0A5P2XG34_STRST|nr:DUF3558 domain-containing protein [Streptomyces spectabilis]MBB5108074.1 hypothetical protein [Streptomyces spectabilis]MCI3904300.1 DUF3558 domain-containing protein [Streptomyces spectabilis]QEV61412.1 DUF3558 domain-containing protein [Streptomyces spectabilis]GGV26358.1 hypothetical protein GCM10010245_43270 [Streptomyces spectabilis]
MQRRKVYVPGAAALLVALLAGCTGDSGHDDGGDGKSGDTGASTTAAEPGRYRTLPEPCGAVDSSTLDAMLPGIEEIEDTDRREKAYAGSPTVTYDTDRRVGCRWKVESADATHHLLVDFERVVSYDGTVSDDARAQQVYRTKLREADVPEPSASGSDEDDEESPSPSGSEGSKGPEDPDAPEGSAKPKGSAGSAGAEGSQVAARPQGGTSAEVGKGDGADPGDTAEAEVTPEGLESRTLDDLGDEAFLTDVLTTAASASRHRTVTVVFRTSNVVVTVEYDEQPARRTEVSDSKEMQDNARELADNLADRFDG